MPQVMHGDGRECALRSRVVGLVGGLVVGLVVRLVVRQINAGRLLAPRTRLGIAGRNLPFTTLTAFSPAMKAFDSPAADPTWDDIPLASVHCLPASIG